MMTQRSRRVQDQDSEAALSASQVSLSSSPSSSALSYSIPPASASSESVNNASSDKASRIAANLARLDATPSLMRAPLQWKGYGWRFAKGFTDPAAPASLMAASGTPVEERMGWKPWAMDGVRRRSVRVICVLVAVAAVVIIFGALGFAAFYGWATSRDPCIVSVDTLHKLQAHPRRSAMVPDFKPVVPKIIHQQWKTTEIPAGPYTKWNLKWKELYPEPEYTHMLWTDENGRKLIKEHFPFFLQAYDNYEFGIQRADATRYFVMYMYGGIYADLDYEPMTNFWAHVPKDRVGLVESPYQYNELAQNSLMTGPKHDPFWNETFEVLLERKDKPVLHATGPMFLDALMKRAKETYTLLPCENFQRLPLHLSKEEEVSPFMSQLHRELLGRLVPMKYCGDYHNKECQYGKHHNTASYLPDTGVLKLLWT